MEDDRAQVDLGIAADIEQEQESDPKPAPRQPKKRFVGRRTAAQTAASKNGTASGSGSIEDAGAIQGNEFP